MLREVGDQEADENDAAADCQNQGPREAIAGGSSHGNSQLDIGGRLEAVAGGGRGHCQGRGLHDVCLPR